jgi:hypothetical protein
MNHDRDLWELLHAASRIGFRVSFTRGTVGQMRVEISHQDGTNVRALEPLGTDTPDYAMLTKYLKKILSVQA